MSVRERAAHLLAKRDEAAMMAPEPRRVGEEPATHDFGRLRRGYGHDYAVRELIAEKPYGLKLTGWQLGIRIGDYLLLEAPDPTKGDGRTRYRVTEIRYCADPPDMWFAEAVFDPRS